MADDQSRRPLARRVPGATRAAPGAQERPALPDVLLQRMQAAVSAAHAQAAEEQRLASEDEIRREPSGSREQAAHRALPSVFQGTEAASNGRTLPYGTALPTPPPPDWSDAVDDTSPLPRLAASGVIAVPDADSFGAQPDSKTLPDRGVPPHRDGAPDHALRRDRGPKRDRQAAKRERAARREQERAERLERARQERERAAEQARQRTAERERQLAAERERQHAAQLERERAELERERAAEQERERAAELERERAAQLERERAAQLERERAAQLERERADQERERDAERERQRAAEFERQRAEQERERAAERARERAEQPESPPVAAAAQPSADPLEHPGLNARRPRNRRRYRPAAVAASALILVAGGSLAFALSTRGPAGTPGRSVPALTLAVSWVGHEVSRTATVACDPAMCRALEASGVERLLVLGPATADPRLSQLIIATAAVRAEFGVSLGAAYAPSVIASFGSGSTRIDIRVVAPTGPAAYAAALNTDVQNRMQAGAELLGSPRVVASASARRQMLAGQVSSQLLIVMTSLATLHSVDIL
ncbi:MAG TPA: MAP7 domain-containing protein, partial [Streptosporangiaceae bacterium]|nr:MAP7 domain-containing protein [Streptosporangiaceae bacterium]